MLCLVMEAVQAVHHTGISVVVSPDSHAAVKQVCWVLTLADALVHSSILTHACDMGLCACRCLKAPFQA